MTWNALDVIFRNCMQKKAPPSFNREVVHSHSRGLTKAPQHIFCTQPTHISGNCGVTSGEGVVFWLLAARHNYYSKRGGIRETAVQQKKKLWNQRSAQKCNVDYDAPRDLVANHPHRGAHPHLFTAQVGCVPDFYCLTPDTGTELLRPGAHTHGGGTFFCLFLRFLWNGWEFEAGMQIFKALVLKFDSFIAPRLQILVDQSRSKTNTFLPV